MKGLQEVFESNVLIAQIFRSNITLEAGVNFFSHPNNPLQIAIQYHKDAKETKTHTNKVTIPIKLTIKNKYVYIIKGSAVVQFLSYTGKIKKQYRLKSGDGVVIMDALHKFIFAPDTKLIEIKQGPYKKNEI